MSILKSFIKEIILLEKKQGINTVLYVYVPQTALDSIKENGLLSGEKLYNSSELLKLARPNKNDRQKWIKQYKENIKDPEISWIYKGISAFFTPVDMNKLSKDHFIKKNNLKPIQIKIIDFLSDHSKTKLKGVELKPYFSEMSDKEFKEREKELSKEDIIKYSKMKPKDIWKYYNPEDTEHYASDVPHVIIMKSNIDPDYLIF